MTNSQSLRAIDWVIGKLYFELSVYCVPKSNPANKLILLYICSDNQTKSRTQDMVCGFFNLRRVEKG
jgi:hypothetical protein